MPHYFFHLLTADGFEPDDEGISFPDLEAAKADALSSLLEMAADDVAAGRTNKYHGVEVADSNGLIIGRLSVDEALHR
jgi:hypothetical protein